jgi:hypothetical protein
MFRVAAVFLVLLGLLAAGCGNNAGTTFTAAGTVGCLRDQGFTRVTRSQAKIGLIAAFAANGGLRAQAKNGNVVTIAFASDETEAKSTQAAFKNQASPFYKRRINDVMRADGNAVMVWQTAPSQEQMDTVEHCLGR